MIMDLEQKFLVELHKVKDGGVNNFVLEHNSRIIVAEVVTSLLCNLAVFVKFSSIIFYHGTESVKVGLKFI